MGFQVGVMQTNSTFPPILGEDIIPEWWERRRPVSLQAPAAAWARDRLAESSLWVFLFASFVIMSTCFLVGLRF